MGVGGGGERRGRRLVGGAALGGGQARPHSTWFSACLPGLGGLNPVCGWDGGGMGGAPVCPGLGVCARMKQCQQCENIAHMSPGNGTDCNGLKSSLFWLGWLVGWVEGGTSSGAGGRERGGKGGGGSK